MPIRVAAKLSVLLLLIGATSVASSQGMRALRVCADPGNLPFSNDHGEGLENKIAAVLAQALGTTVQYYFRPSIERGLTRTTLDADECDVMLDMPLDSERVLTTSALYRTTFVLAYRDDKGLAIKNFDDPRLKSLRVGVYQTSAIRQVLADHDVRDNVVIHYLSHDADLVPEDQPAHQVQQVIDGQLDIAAVWGPFAGYFKASKHAPLTIQPVNLMEDSVPMEYDMALAVRASNGELRERLEHALHEKRDAIRAILTDYGVPLVRCESCIVSGDLPAHGPYVAAATPAETAGPAAPAVSIAMLDSWLAQGADVNVELNNAVIGDDLVRVAYLLDKKHASIDAVDLQGETPLLHALGKKSLPMVKYLLEHGASAQLAGRDGWTPLLTAAWVNDAAAVRLLAGHGAKPDTAGPDNLTPLGVALHYGRDAAALALIESGAEINRPIGTAGYTPLMVAVAQHSGVTAQALIKKGANVNAQNSGGVTALMIAATANQAELVALLLQSGANAAAKTEAGDTALSLARAKGNEAIVKMLEEGAGPANAAHSGA